MAESICIREGEAEDEELFFDSRDDISSASSSSPGTPERNDSSSFGELLKWASSNARSEVWGKDPDSVKERRDKFLRLMGLDGKNCSPGSDIASEESKLDGGMQLDTERVMSDSGAVLSSSYSENMYSMSSWSNEETRTSSNNGVCEEQVTCRIKNLNDGTIFIVNELDENGSLKSLREVGSNQTIRLDEFGRIFGSSSMIQQLMRREDNPSVRSNNSSVSSKSAKSVRNSTIRWFKRLGAAACVLDRQGDESESSICDSTKSESSTSGRINVRPHRKQLKELSAIYKRQDIKAHDGRIWTMKFSPDGEYLATGGEDGVVRVWHVVEYERNQEFIVPEDDPSCIYFKINHNSQLTPLHADYEKKVKSAGLRKNSESACVVIPPEKFHLDAEPVHEFRGHGKDVLDLSWSKTKLLLSSSMDKTVRLWQVGSTRCLKVFPHNDYVTCVQFNPAQESYFISGSIDGKVRIWAVPDCRVVHWIDTKQIVSAVCYHPDGKRVVVGTLTGACHFYDASDNFLRVDSHTILHGKKKSSSKINKLEFCPSDQGKLMVSSADSKILILEGADVVAKFKGPRNSGSHISASFTADGHHIISASDDSNVYVWNHDKSSMPTSGHVKNTSSCERFFSSNALVAIPWHGFQSSDHVSASTNELNPQQVVIRDKTGLPDVGSDCYVEDPSCNNIQNTQNMSPSNSFTLDHEFSHFLPKGSATWPEEKLPSKSAKSVLRKSHYKFLKSSCQNASHAWNQVIVTAGLDGWIRCYQNFGLPLRL